MYAFVLLLLMLLVTADVATTEGPVQLTLYDVTGIPIQTQKIGRLVSLKGAATGSNGEVGIRATYCDAVGNTGLKYSLLKDGCGDGTVFRNSDGFVTTGLTIESPYFRMFSLNGQSSLTFYCNYTLCQEPCDGSSCLAAP